MKKIIALALALIMALSMASVAFAADYQPGEKLTFNDVKDEGRNAKRNWKVSYDFTSADKEYEGASLIDSIVIDKEGVVVLTLKESLTSTTNREVDGVITLTSKVNKDANGDPVKKTITVKDVIVGNDTQYIAGEKKAKDADDADISAAMKKNNVMIVDEAGYASFTYGNAIAGVVKVEKDEKAQVYVTYGKANAAEETVEAIEAYLGEDYEGIVEWYNFEGTGFKNDVDFRYDAYEEDPHFFYVWDGEKFVDLGAKYDADEEVDDYVFTAAAKGIIIVTDVEIVAGAEETKNPDTGANDVVGVAAALAVVSLVAAGAVSLKK